MENSDNKIAAGIVLYNPDIERLRMNINAVCGQVEKIFLVDNASSNISEIQQLLERYPICRLVRNQDNKGIAEALNQLMEQAEKQDYRWLLTLDDDSVCDKDMVQKLSLYTENKEAGIICPEAVDDKMEMCTVLEQTEMVFVDDCITAGSLTNIDIWRKIGGFDSRMFIDFVDVEYCTRLRMNGYKICKVKSACIHQQYGNIKGSFTFLGKKYYKFDYSPVRIYYSVRNQVYFMKKYRKYIAVFKQFLFLLGYIGKRIVFEKNRLKSIRSIIRGIKDGIRMHV